MSEGWIVKRMRELVTSPLDYADALRRSAAQNDLLRDEIERLRADNAVVLGLNGTLRAAMREVYETPCYCTPDKCMRCEAINAAMGGDNDE